MNTTYTDLDSFALLIHSLSYQEIQNLLGDSGMRNSSSLFLFYVISESSHNSKAEIEKLVRKLSIKNYSQLKKKLTSMIIENIYANNIKSTGHNAFFLEKNVQYAKIFFQRGVYDLCFKTIEDSFNQIEEMELYGYSSNLFDITTKLFEIGYISHSAYLKISQTYKSHIEKLSNIFDYKMLYDYLKSIVEQKTYLDETTYNVSITDLLKSPLLTNKIDYSITGAIFFHQIYIYYEDSYLKNTESAFQHAEKILSLYDQNETYKSVHQHEFIETLIQLGNLSIKLLKVSSTEKVLQTLKNLEQTLIKDYPLSYTEYILLSMNHLKSKKNYKEFRTSCDEYKATAEQYQIFSSNTLKLRLLSNLFSSEFIHSPEHELNFYVQQMEQLLDIKKDPQYFIITNLMIILFYLETDSLHLAWSKIRSLERYFTIYPEFQSHKNIFRLLKKTYLKMESNNQGFSKDNSENLKELYTNFLESDELSFLPIGFPYQYYAENRLSKSNSLASKRS